MKVASLALRFLLELAALGALAYWGFREVELLVFGAAAAALIDADAVVLGISFVVVAVVNGVVVRRLGERPALDSAG